MFSSLEKFKKNDLFFALVFLILSLTPILLKLTLSEQIGPTFNFYFFIVWIPVITLTLAVARGWKEGSITGLLLVGTIIFSLVNYPLDPLMDFRRQIVHQSDVLIVVAAVTSIGLQIVLRRRRIKDVA